MTGRPVCSGIRVALTTQWAKRDTMEDGVTGAFQSGETSRTAPDFLDALHRKFGQLVAAGRRNGAAGRGVAGTAPRLLSFGRDPSFDFLELSGAKECGELLGVLGRQRVGHLPWKLKSYNGTTEHGGRDWQIRCDTFQRENVVRGTRAPRECDKRTIATDWPHGSAIEHLRITEATANGGAVGAPPG